MTREEVLEGIDFPEVRGAVENLMDKIEDSEEERDKYIQRALYWNEESGAKGRHKLLEYALYL